MQPERDQAFFETILSSIADGVFTVDRDWRITSFNQRGGADHRRAGRARHRQAVLRGLPRRHLRARLRPAPDARDRPQASSTMPARILSQPGPVGPHQRQHGRAPRRGRHAARRGGDLPRPVRPSSSCAARSTTSTPSRTSSARARRSRRSSRILPDIAESESTVLIEGPSGSGKELLARAIHNLSPRRNRPYVVVNCGTLPTNLFESELFGYVQGAFTDAKRDKPGRITLAEGGTIFFDEIGDLPPETQVKLLRLLQEREYEPLGGVEDRAGQRARGGGRPTSGWPSWSADGRFRDDLYFRLAWCGSPFRRSRERREDIPYLVEHFVQRFNAKQRQADPGRDARRDGDADAARLPGQRPRARERHRVRLRALPQPADRRVAPARGAPALASRGGRGHSPRRRTSSGRRPTPSAPPSPAPTARSARPPRSSASTARRSGAR